jgi:hypothetical protein
MEAQGKTFFDPVKLSARDKAAATDHTARAIIDAESVARKRKSEKLKSLRLEQEALQPPAEEAPKRRKAAATPKARTTGEQ